MMIDARHDLPYFDEKLDSFCCIPVKPISILSAYLKERGINKSNEDIIADLKADYKTAYEDRTLEMAETRMAFATRYKKDDGTPVKIVLRPNDYAGNPWYLFYVDTTPCAATAASSNPSKQLENFAFLGSWTSFLTELANKAIPEQWDFVGGAEGQYRILIQYIKHTFSRLMFEKKVCISDDKQFAAFNTGLVDKHYDDIYACFVPNGTASTTKWKFLGFCTAASGNFGKQLVKYFHKLPEPPTYFTKNDDMIFDTSRPLYLDFEHIIIDNIGRLPLQFLYDQFYSNEEARDLVVQLKSKSTSDTKRDELYSRLRVIIDDDTQLFKRLCNRIQDAANLAMKRVRWNYRTAIPLYYTKNNSISLMLPLALVDDEKADVALVVELMPSGSYQGHTILTLAQAYIDARLVCRLTGDWLDPIKIAEYQKDNED